MKFLSIAACFSMALASSGGASAEEFNSFGEYVIHNQTKITGSGKAIQVPIKPLKLLVSTDGVTVRLSTPGQTDSWSSFTIYRSDGIGQQKAPGGPLEVVPGVQATSDHGGVHKHLRLTRDTLTLTVFPGVSDQTVVTHAIHSRPPDDEPAADSREESPAP